MRKDNLKRQKRAAEGRNYHSDSEDGDGDNGDDFGSSDNTSNRNNKNKRSSKVLQEAETFKVPKPKAPYNTENRVNEPISAKTDPNQGSDESLVVKLNLQESTPP